MSKKWIEKLKNLFADNGYTCDVCGAEVFDYPHPRICKKCAEELSLEYEICDKCGRPTLTKGVCLTCKNSLPSFERGVSAFAYHGAAAKSVNRLKEGEPHLSVFFGEEMVKAWQAAGVETEVVVTYVPAFKERKRVRGYDQAEKLAKVVATRLALPMEETLVCIGCHDKQKELSFAERKKNVAGNYRVVERKKVKGKAFLLVDDILTTGATGSECAERLKRAGALEVYFLTATALPERR